MGPGQAAIQLFRAWMATRPEPEWFPVNCHEIARGLGVKVHGEPFNDAFEGALCISDGMSAIIYNEGIDETGRKNFTIAHELGHYSLHKNQNSLRCSMGDLGDYGSALHTKNIEQEANQFAATLLMPANDVRSQMANKTITIELAGQLKVRYGTTLTATSYRLAELSGKPIAIVEVRNDRIYRSWTNDAMRQTGFWQPKGSFISSDVLALSDPNEPVDASLWLDDHKAKDWEIFQSYAKMPSYDKTLFIVRAVSREGERDMWDDVEDSVDKFPKW